MGASSIQIGGRATDWLNHIFCLLPDKAMIKLEKRQMPGKCSSVFV
jgi:hypothetical protein